MNENINLCEILKDCPKGTVLYSTIYGQVSFLWIDEDYEYPIVFSLTNDEVNCVTANGMATHLYKGECTLFPSRDQRDWSKWKCPKPKFDPKMLKAFDRVLARIDDGDAYCWFADFVSMPALEDDTTVCVIGDRDVSMVIPYNDETKHLVGTSDKAPKFYRYWED